LGTKCASKEKMNERKEADNENYKQNWRENVEYKYIFFFEVQWENHLK